MNKQRIAKALGKLAIVLTWMCPNCHASHGVTLTRADAEETIEDNVFETTCNKCNSKVELHVLNAEGLFEREAAQ